MGRFVRQSGQRAGLILSLFLLCCACDDDAGAAGDPAWQPVAYDGGTGLSTNMGCASPFITPASLSGLDLKQVSLYRDDAFRLAARHAEAQGGSLAASIQLPLCLVQDLFSSLIRVHRWSLDRGDAGVAPGLHARTSPHLDGVGFLATTDTPWVKALKAGNKKTGNPALNLLLERYELKVEYSEFEFIPGAMAADIVLKSSSPINAYALARAIRQATGIKNVNTGFTMDGDDIAATYPGGHWQLDLKRRFGDCPMGCIQQILWRFRGGPGSQLEYVGRFD